jgi:hypothetical protein
MPGDGLALAVPVRGEVELVDNSATVLFFSGLMM